MLDWIAAETPVLDIVEQTIFDKIYNSAVEKIAGWSEEDLKMKFICHVLPLGYLEDNGRFLTYFEKTISATVEGHYLSTKSDFMVATGILDKPKKPYFHFQEYKPQKNPTGDPMAQLLEAFLIALHQNRKERKEIPLYGCEIVGAIWRFVTMEDKTYCVSKIYNCENSDDLKQIIAILRKFREILETRLLD